MITLVAGRNNLNIRLVPVVPLPYPRIVDRAGNIIPYHRPSVEEIRLWVLGSPDPTQGWNRNYAAWACHNWASQNPYPRADYQERLDSIGYAYLGGGWTWYTPDAREEWWEGWYAFFPGATKIQWAAMKVYLASVTPPQTTYLEMIARVEAAGWLK